MPLSSPDPGASAAATLDLNNPDTRQAALLGRLRDGAPLVAGALAREFGVSTDTIRRDLIALEQGGALRRVRGGAVPVAPPMPTYAQRARAPEQGVRRLGTAAVARLPPGATVFLDGGTTLGALAENLPIGFGGHVITPAPAVALAALARGAPVHLIGGTLCADGALATGGEAERAIESCAADLAILGACGLHPGFGLATDDAAEAGVKRAMARASASVMVVAGAAKLARRARHRVLPPEGIDTLVTDAGPEACAEFVEAGVEVVHV